MVWYCFKKILQEDFVNNDSRNFDRLNMDDALIHTTESGLFRYFIFRSGNKHEPENRKKLIFRINIGT